MVGVNGGIVHGKVYTAVSRGIAESQREDGYDAVQRATARAASPHRLRA